MRGESNRFDFRNFLAANKSCGFIMSNPTAAISSAAYPGSFAIKYPIARIAALPTICRAIQGNSHHDAFTNKT